MSRRRARTLRPDERVLWHQVARSVTPLRPEARGEPPAAEPAIPETAPAALAAAEPSAPKAAAKPPPLASLEPRLRRRLSRGAEVDARLDLHGLTQDAAHRRLRAFIIEAQALGMALVLVITGKGAPEGFVPHGPEARGVLRRSVPLWLAEPALRPYVVGFEMAARRHGGEGALYIRIRRARRPEAGR